MSTLVTGSRGTVGRAVLARLHSAGHAVRAASARPAGLAVPDGVEAVGLALDRPEALEGALHGVRQIFLYPQPAGIDALIEAAQAAGVEHVVLLSSASVLAPDAEDDPLARHSLLVERALAGSGLAHTFLRPDAFAANAVGWAHSIGRGLPVRLAHPDARTAPIHSEDIADIAVEALTGGSLAGRTVALTGPESLSFREQLAVLADVLGRGIRVERISRAEAERQMGAYMPAPMVASLLRFWEAADGVPATLHDTTLSLLGRPARTFRQWAGENTAAFGGH
ncbi:NAD(P)H-binding protein [Streptomyces sp. NPDC093094]|uniref:NAD(P)H-binding protein n=1 Tax=Streptomyces sp. NPDC093094 TaxID=3366026 RepID=UPI0038009400